MKVSSYQVFVKPEKEMSFDFGPEFNTMKQAETFLDKVKALPKQEHPIWHNVDFTIRKRVYYFET